MVFKRTEVPYIGQVLTSEGVKADPSKVEAVLNMERLTDVTGVQRVMGTADLVFQCDASEGALDPHYSKMVDRWHTLAEP